MRISVIIPSKNSGQYIEQAILSVLGQNIDGLEIIVIDGGSSDGTISILERYSRYLTYWVSEPDSGQANAINKGFNISCGNVLAWLNADDFYLPGALAKALHKIEEKKNRLFAVWWLPIYRGK